VAESIGKNTTDTITTTLTTTLLVLLNPYLCPAHLVELRVVLGGGLNRKEAGGKGKDADTEAPNVGLRKH